MGVVLESVATVTGTLGVPVPFFLLNRPGAGEAVGLLLPEEAVGLARAAVLEEAAPLAAQVEAEMFLLLPQVKETTALVHRDAVRLQRIEEAVAVARGLPLVALTEETACHLLSREFLLFMLAAAQVETVGQMERPEPEVEGVEALLTVLLGQTA